MALEDARHLKLVNWLTTPPNQREPRTQKAFAESLGVSERTIRDWKERPEVRAAWEKQAKEVAGDPEKVSMALDKLYQTAMDPEHKQHVQAMKLWLEAVEAIRPPSLDVSFSNKTSAELSDEELRAMIAAGAQSMLAERESTL
jgi:hypothetical protein